MKLAIPLRATIPHLVSKNWDPGHNKSAVSDVRVTSCFADFDQQNGFTGIAATGAVLRLRLETGIAKHCLGAKIVVYACL